MSLVHQIEFGNLVWEVGPRCFIYQPEHRLLVVADLHLGKGEHFAYLGYPIPLYDASDTLSRLSSLIDYFRPYTVVLLGDSFHTSLSLKSLSSPLFHQLENIIKQCESFIWLVGNHDSTLLEHKKLEGVFLSSFTLKDIILSHMPLATDAPQIVGHYHPKIKVKIRAKVFQGKCYVKSEKLLVMPSFGTYTGGLYVSDPDFRKILGSHLVDYYLIYDQGVFQLENSS